jgi:hypothetical protein
VLAACHRSHPQVVLSPLLDELSKLAKLPEGEAPVRRLAIIQVREGEGSL